MSKIKNKNFIKNTKGFTLIEILIYVAIFALISSGLVSYALTMVEIKSKNFVVLEVDASSRMALEIISDKIRSAESVNIAECSFDTDPGILSLSMNDSAKDPTVIDLNTDDGTLRITQGTDDSVNLTGDNIKVSNLIFRNYTSPGQRNNIKVEMTFEYKNTSSSKEFEYKKSIQTAVNLRK